MKTNLLDFRGTFYNTKHSTVLKKTEPGKLIRLPKWLYWRRAIYEIRAWF